MGTDSLSGFASYVSSLEKKGYYIGLYIFFSWTTLGCFLKCRVMEDA